MIIEKNVFGNALRINKMLKMVTFHRISQKAANFMESCPFYIAHHGRKLQNMLGH